MRRMLVGVFGLATLAVAGFAAICAILYFDQDSSIFFPRPNDARLWEAQQANRVEIATPGATLEGWWIENRDATSPATILYFGGNGEDVLRTARAADKLNARRILFVNYRGYGRSTGEPGQAALYEDALAIYDHALRRGSTASSIVVMGRSLGSGVAAMLAASRPVGAAILVTPYDSLTAVASARYPMVPVRLLLRHPFPSIDWAAQTRVPALMLAAERDTVIPAYHAQKLFEAWSGRKQMQVLTRSGHNDVDAHPDYYPAINEFLTRETSEEPRDQKDQDPVML